MTKHDSLTIDQCRKLKEWGYPQEGAKKYYQRATETTWVLVSIRATHDDENYVAVPTERGMMDWILLDKRVAAISITKRKTGVCLAGAEDDCIYDPRESSVVADSPLLALYKLAEQVKKEK